MPNKRILYFLIISLIFFQKSVFSFIVFPPDTIPLDTTTKIQYDTIRIQKIVLVYDTIKVFDTIVRYDSSMFKPVFLNTVLFSVGGGIPQVILSKNIPASVKELIQAGERRRFSPCINLSYRRQFENWSSEIGFGLLQINQQANYNFTTTQINSHLKIDSIDNSYWNVTVIDTFYQVIGTDSTMQIVADSTWVPSFDTTQVTEYDTIKNKQEFVGRNQYAYFRIPMIVRYNILKSRKITVQSGGGIIAGFLIKTNGKTLTNDSLLHDIDNLSSVRTNFFFYFDAEIDYRLSSRIYIFSTLAGEIMLKSFFPEKVSGRKIHYLSAKAGVLYNF